MSLLGKDPCENTTAPTNLSIFTASCSILITIVSSVGNSLVVLAVFLNPNRDMRTPFYYFVVNLSIADLIVGLITGSMSTVYHIFAAIDEPKKLFGTVLIVAFFVSCTVSLLSLTALALERYLAIVHPTTYRTQLSPVRAFLVSVLVWILSILLTMIYFFVQYNIYRFIFANTALAVTIVALIFTNAKILKYLRHQMQQWDTFHESTEENLIMRQLMWEKKMTKTLLIVMLLLLAFYLPSCIFIYIINLCKDCNCVFIHWIRDTQFLLVMANSAVNPFVFPWRLENFRSAFRSIVTCRARRSDSD
ncbi:adenosine receptor A1-like [Orbicella faveolata]|uniref:adenosine receptor A1-like n=1 Tax=Orbicella faveolata TaxID=48498 RepID=UPI0009E4F1F8|nr:adenosine receptor A1-like [Orbicella faveolata]